LVKRKEKKMTYKWTTAKGSKTDEIKELVKKAKELDDLLGEMSLGYEDINYETGNKAQDKSAEILEMIRRLEQPRKKGRSDEGRIKRTL